MRPVCWNITTQILKNTRDTLILFYKYSINIKKRFYKKMRYFGPPRTAVPKLWVATPIGVNLQFSWGRLAIYLGSSDNLPGVA